MSFEKGKENFYPTCTSLVLQLISMRVCNRITCFFLVVVLFCFVFLTFICLLFIYRYRLLRILGAKPEDEIVLKFWMTGLNKQYRSHLLTCSSSGSSSWARHAWSWYCSVSPKCSSADCVTCSTVLRFIGIANRLTPCLLDFAGEFIIGPFIREKKRRVLCKTRLT